MYREILNWWLSEMMSMASRAARWHLLQLWKQISTPGVVVIKEVYTFLEIYQAIQFHNLNFKSLPLVQMVYGILTVNIFVTTFLCYKILIFTNHVCQVLGEIFLALYFKIASCGMQTSWFIFSVVTLGVDFFLPNSGRFFLLLLF